MNECTCGETTHAEGWCDGFGQYICIEQNAPRIRKKYTVKLL